MTVGLLKCWALAALLSAASMFAPTYSHAADILEELRKGQHYEADQINGSGPDVLRDALAGKASMVNLLGMYFSNGERGFPADRATAMRLYEKAYDMGQWSSGLELAREAQEAKDYKKALKLYMTVYLVAAEKNQRDFRNKSFTLSEPGFTHIAYAGVQHINMLKLVSEADMAAIEKEARSEGVNRGWFKDCEQQGTRQCAAAESREARATCEVAIINACYAKP